MLYHTTPVVEQFGLVRFRNWRVLELDSWPDDGGTAGPGLVRPTRDALERAMARMAIVVPIRDERVKFLEGVLAGIPRGVRVFVVSNSARSPNDRFRIERAALAAFSQATGRRVVLIHQRDAGLGRALRDAGYGGLLGDDGLVPHGKGESMAIGVLAALAEDYEHVGFMDADNYVPGAVLEHVWNYAAGFASLPLDHVCVREVWHFKPKPDEAVMFKRAGRVSRVTNQYVNRLIAHYTGFETDEVRTANSGEHAFSRDLALRMPLASGFAVETWQLRWMLEEWGGVLPGETPRSRGVDIVQVETKNPHFHESKGSEHILGMLAASLGVLYHSPLAYEGFRAEVRNELAGHGWIGDPPEPRVLPPPAAGDLATFGAWLSDAQEKLEIGPGITQ